MTFYCNHQSVWLPLLLLLQIISPIVIIIILFTIALWQIRDDICNTNACLSLSFAQSVGARDVHVIVHAVGFAFEEFMLRHSGFGIQDCVGSPAASWYLEGSGIFERIGL